MEEEMGVVFSSFPGRLGKGKASGDCSQHLSVELFCFGMYFIKCLKARE